MKKETITQVLLMILKSLKRFFNDGAKKVLQWWYEKGFLNDDPEDLKDGLIKVLKGALIKSLKGA